jgi:hypothetical protein
MTSGGRNGGALLISAEIRIEAVVSKARAY